MAASHHGCWVCASREEKLIEEPGMSQKARNYVEDKHLMRDLEEMLVRLNRFSGFVFVLLILFGFHGVYASNGVMNSLGGVSLLKIVGSLVIGLGTIFTANVAMLQDEQVVDDVSVEKDEYDTEGNREKLANVLSGFIQLKTISHDVDSDEQTDPKIYLKAHDFLRDNFPLVHNSKSITVTKINTYSLLYEWKGKDEDLEPVMLCAHMDVVPTPNASKWSVDDPFCGKIDNEGTIWGRGAIDNKHNVVTQLEAVERLLASGVEKLSRTVFLAFGHDEEVGGSDGAKYLAKELETRLKGKKMEFILDEGAFLIKGILPGVPQAVGIISNKEKGNVSVKLEVEAVPPGHSSMPDKESNIGILSQAIQRLENRPFPASMDSFVDSLKYVSSQLPFWLRLVVANTWFFGPVLKHVTLKKNSMAASVRTTTAVTIAKAGEKINVLPGKAIAWVNHRIHPKDIDNEHVLAYDRKVIADSRVKVTQYSGSGFSYIPPSPISPLNSSGFVLLKHSVAKCFGAPVMPSIMVGNTDTRWYWDLSDCIYRFTPVVFEKLEDTKMFHGIDERISTKNLSRLAHFYTTILEHYNKTP